jgi:hypothetical protein
MQQVYLKHLTIYNISTFVLLTCLMIVYFLSPDFLFNNANTYCLHRILFKFDCPICGLTRAVYSALHGQFKQAFFYNMGILPLIFLIIQHFLSYFLKYEFSRRINQVLLWFLAIILISIYSYKAIVYFTKNETFLSLQH